MKAYLMPLGRAFCENKPNVCDNYATHTVALERVGSLGGRYCEEHAKRIAYAVNVEIGRPEIVPASSEPVA